jgi:hypothetical protein
MSTTFEIHVRGVLAQQELEHFEHLAAITVPAETILTGVIPDQSALYGVLNRLQALGLELVEVRPLDRETPSGAGPTPTHPDGPAPDVTRVG